MKTKDYLIALMVAIVATVAIMLPTVIDIIVFKGTEVTLQQAVIREAVKSFVAFFIGCCIGIKVAKSEHE